MVYWKPQEANEDFHARPMWCVYVLRTDDRLKSGIREHQFFNQLSNGERGSKIVDQTGDRGFIELYVTKSPGVKSLVYICTAQPASTIRILSPPSVCRTRMTPSASASTPSQRGPTSQGPGPWGSRGTPHKDGTPVLGGWRATFGSGILASVQRALPARRHCVACSGWGILGTVDRLQGQRESLTMFDFRQPGRESADREEEDLRRAPQPEEIPGQPPGTRAVSRDRPEIRQVRPTFLHRERSVRTGASTLSPARLASCTLTKEVGRRGILR